MAALKKTSVLLALMFMVLAFTSTANAQATLGAIQCTAAPDLVIARAEGVSENQGKIVISCVNIPGVSVDVVQYIPTNVLVLANNTNFTNSIGLVTGGGATTTEAVIVINSNDSTTPLDASVVPSTTAIDSRFPRPQYMRLLGDNLLEALQMQFPVPGAPTDGVSSGGAGAV